MQVQIEEARFASQQSQATTLLALMGVIASIGGGFLVGFNGRHYELSVGVFGRDISLVAVGAGLAGLVAIVGLLRAGTSAVVVMRQKPDPAPQNLIPVLNDQFPEMIDEEAATAARALLELLAAQCSVLQLTNAKIRSGLKEAAAGIALAVLGGLVLAGFMLIGTHPGPQDVHLTNRDGENTVAIRAAR